MVRFSLKRLFASVSTIAVGLGIWSYANWARPYNARANFPKIREETYVLLLFAALLIIGAGIGSIFKRPFLGAVIAASSYAIYLIIILALQR